MPRSEFQLYSCEEEGVDSQAVINFVNGLNETGLEYHNFILFRNSHMIARGSWKPYDGRHVHNIHSSSKSFTATAIGMLWDRGEIDLDARVCSFFPGRSWPLANGRFEELSVRHLLTMSLGQDFEAFEGDFNDWVDAVLGQPIVRTPGTRFFYSSMCSHMLSEIVTRITGVSVLTYLRTHMFEPMGFGINYWFAGPGNTVAGGGGLHISIDDFAKLGLLYLNKGVYEGRRYLSEAWVAMAVSLQIETAPAYAPSKVENSQGYGFQFWRCTHNGYRASGMWAQMCLVLPDQHIVLAVQSSAQGSEATLRQVWKYLLPGIGRCPMEPDGVKARALEEFLKRQHIMVPAGSRSSRLESLIPEHYEFTRNPYGFQSMDLKFSEKAVSLSISHKWGRYEAQASRGGFGPDSGSNLADLTHLERDLHMPDKPDGYVPPEIYSCAVWLDESRLLISQRLLNAASQIKWLLRFDGSCVQLVHQSENVYGSFEHIILLAPYR